MEKARKCLCRPEVTETDIPAVWREDDYWWDSELSDPTFHRVTSGTSQTATRQSDNQVKSAAICSEESHTRGETGQNKPGSANCPGSQPGEGSTLQLPASQTGARKKEPTTNTAPASKPEVPGTECRALGAAVKPLWRQWKHKASTERHGEEVRYEGDGYINRDFLDQLNIKLKKITIQPVNSDPITPEGDAATTKAKIPPLVSISPGSTTPTSPSSPGSAPTADSQPTPSLLLPLPPPPARQVSRDDQRSPILDMPIFINAPVMLPNFPPPPPKSGLRRG